MAIEKGLARYYAGDFNSLSQQWQPDGSVIMTFWRDDEQTAVVLHVADLHGDAESAISERAIERVATVRVRARQMEAQQWLNSQQVLSPSPLDSIPASSLPDSAPDAPIAP